MAKIAIEHKHSKVFKIFRRNITPTDRMEQLDDVDVMDVHDCMVDLMELYKEVARIEKLEYSLGHDELTMLLEVDL